MDSNVWVDFRYKYENIPQIFLTVDQLFNNSFFLTNCYFISRL